MVKFTAAICPTCKAPLTGIDATTKSCECSFCGTNIFIENGEAQEAYDNKKYNKFDKVEKYDDEIVSTYSDTKYIRSLIKKEEYEKARSEIYSRMNFEEDDVELNVLYVLASCGIVEKTPAYKDSSMQEGCVILQDILSYYDLVKKQDKKKKYIKELDEYEDKMKDYERIYHEKMQYKNMCNSILKKVSYADGQLSDDEADDLIKEYFGLVDLTLEGKPYDELVKINKDVEDKYDEFKLAVEMRVKKHIKEEELKGIMKYVMYGLVVVAAVLFLFINPWITYIVAAIAWFIFCITSFKEPDDRFKLESIGKFEKILNAEYGAGLLSKVLCGLGVLFIILFIVIGIALIPTIIYSIKLLGNGDGAYIEFFMMDVGVALSWLTGLIYGLVNIKERTTDLLESLWVRVLVSGFIFIYVSLIFIDLFVLGSVTGIFSAIWFVICLVINFMLMGLLSYVTSFIGTILIGIILFSVKSILHTKGAVDRKKKIENSSLYKKISSFITSSIHNVKSVVVTNKEVRIILNDAPSKAFVFAEEGFSNLNKVGFSIIIELLSKKCSGFKMERLKESTVLSNPKFIKKDVKRVEVKKPLKKKVVKEDKKDKEDW